MNEKTTKCVPIIFISWLDIRALNAQTENWIEINNLFNNIEALCIYQTKCAK